jgi:thiamine phosphate synthase YjbQ (UPF0047 family)
MVYTETIRLTSKDKAITFHNVTQAVKNAVKNSKIKNGIVNVYSHHTTCSVITQEQAFDMSVSGLETLQQDFVEVLEKFIPDCKREGIYLHPGPKALIFAAEHGEDARGCHNTDAHLRSALIGRSETIAVVNSEADLGEFGNVYFIDFDTTRARNRTVQLTVIGE